MADEITFREKIAEFKGKVLATLENVTDDIATLQKEVNDLWAEINKALIKVAITSAIVGFVSGIVSSVITILVRSWLTKG